MSELTTPRKRLKRIKPDKSSKKSSKNKTVTPIKIKIPTPIKKVKLTTSKKKNENKITTNKINVGDEIDTQEGQDEKTDLQKLGEEKEQNAAKANSSTINVKSAKKNTKNKTVTPLKIKIPTPLKKVKLTTPKKKVENKIISKKIDFGDDSDTQEGEDEEIDWQKLEEELERNAVKANLTTINVKSILHHILSDKRVIELAQRVEKDPSDTKLGDVFGETKLTRSKARLLGYQPLPLSSDGESKSTILDVEFPDSSSSDEEYHPADEEDPISDEELSHLSDFYSETASPCLSTSSLRSKRRGVSETLSESDSSIIMTPDINRIKNKKSLKVSNKDPLITPKNVFAIPDLPSACTAEEEDDDLIASRTRSRFPMPGVEVEEIAASFVPPDCTIDFSYLQNIDDPEELTWNNWLLDLAKPWKALNDTGDDDVNDEDFNYMQEVDEEDAELENEEFRNDKATRVPQKELKELINDLLFGYEDEYTYCENVVKDESQIRTEEELKPKTIEAAESLDLTFDQREHIIGQMQQHVQLLTQIYMTTCTIQDHKNEASQCKQYVEELFHFQNKAIQNSDSGVGHLYKELSTFCTPGISDAYRIIKSLQGMTIRCVAHKGKTKVQNIPINDTIVEMFATEPYFATYNELLPDQGMESHMGKKRMPRMKFTKSEDNLLALGLDQFKGRDKFEDIRTHLLPTWTPKQLSTRAKNLSNRYINNANPVAVLRKYKVLPELEAKVKIDVPREISKLPLLKLPRTVWKGRIIPSWYLKAVKNLQLDGKEGPMTEMATEILPKTEDDMESNSSISPQNKFNNNINSNNTNFNHSVESVPFYGASSPSLSGMNLPTISGSMSAPSGPVIMMPPPMVYQPMPVGGGYAMVPMMYCPVVSGCHGNFSTPKSMLTQNNCYSDPTALMNSRRMIANNQITPLRHQKTMNFQSADRATNVKRSLNYNKSLKKGKNKNNKVDISKNRVIPLTSHFGPKYSTQTYTSVEVIASGQATNNAPVTAVSTPVKNIMNEFGISSMSSDNFNIPFMSLMKDLPSPSSFPHLLTSPSKSLQETSLSAVRQVLTTPKKVVSGKSSCLPSESCARANTNNKNENNCTSSNGNIPVSSNSNTNCVMSVNVQQNASVSNSTKQREDRSMGENYPINNNSLQASSSIAENDGLSSQNESLIVSESSCLKDTVKADDPKLNETSDTNSSLFDKDDTEIKFSDCGSFTSTKSSERPPVATLASTQSNTESNHDEFTLAKPIYSSSSGVNNDSTTLSFPVVCSVAETVSCKTIDVSSNSCSSIKTETSVTQMNTSFPLTPNNDVDNVVCANELMTGDDESSLDANSGGGIDSQTDENASDCPAEPNERNEKRTSSIRKIPPDKMNKRKEKNLKKSNKSRKKLRRKGVFNRSEKMQQKVQDFARMYLHLVKTTLAEDQELFEKFTDLMQEGSCQQLSKLQTYYKVANLFKDYPVLVDNFTGFLDQHEARHVGKFLHWLTRHQIINFHLSCEQYFFNTPGWYMKVVQKILDVTEDESDSEKIFNAVVPMFRGNQSLINQFRSLFPDLTPPPCSEDDFEVIDFNAVLTGSKELDDFEEIQFQPPDSDTMNEFSKRKSKPTGKGNKNKFSKKKSNANITACKLRDLANKRKKNKSTSHPNISDGTDANSDLIHTPEEDLDGNLKETNKENINRQFTEFNRHEGSGNVSTFSNTDRCTTVNEDDIKPVNVHRDFSFNKENVEHADASFSDSFDVVDVSAKCVFKTLPRISTTTGIPPSVSSVNTMINCFTSDVKTEIKQDTTISNRVSNDNSINFVDELNKKLHTAVNSLTNDVGTIISEPSALEYKTPTCVEILNTHVPPPKSDLISLVREDLVKPSTVKSNNSSEVACIKTNVLDTATRKPVTIQNIVPHFDKPMELLCKISNDENQSQQLNETASTFIETHVSSKKPISNNVIPFKAMRSDFNTSFLDSSNSHSDTSKSEGKDIISDLGTESNAPTEITFQSLFPTESNLTLAGQDIFNTTSKCESQHGDYSKPVSSTPLKTEFDVSGSCKPKSNLTSSIKNCSVVNLFDQNGVSKDDQLRRKEHSTLNLTMNEGRIQTNKDSSNLTGTLNAGDDLTFQEHSILTRHLISDETQSKTVPSSSLSFTGILASIIPISDSVPCEVKTGNQGLMGPPSQVREKCTESRQKNVITDGELTFSEHSISTVQLLSITDNNKDDNRTLGALHTSEKSHSVQSSATKSNLKTDFISPTSLTFTGKIKPLPASDKSPSNSSTSPLMPKEVSKRGNNALIGVSNTHSRPLSTDNSQSTLSQKSVDIDFKVYDGKNIGTIEISSDTLLSNKSQNIHVNKQIASSLADEHGESQSTPVVVSSNAFGLFGDISNSTSASADDAEVEMINDRSVNSRSTSAHNTSTPVDVSILHSNDARHVIFDNNSTCSLPDAVANNAGDAKGYDQDKRKKHSNKKSRDINSSPISTSSKMKSSKVVSHTGKRSKKPRKLSRSEIITLTESTSFQDDSCSSFEDNYCFTPASRREQSASESSTAKDTLGTLPFQKIDINKFCNDQKGTQCTVEIVEVNPPIPPSPLTIQKFDEESQQSNRSCFSGYASSPQTPIFVSSYVEVKTNDADTPNSSFNVVDSITADLILKSESCQQAESPDAKIKEGIVDESSLKGKKEEKQNCTPKKKIKRKKDVRRLRLSDIIESNENTSPTIKTDQTDSSSGNAVVTKRKRKESPVTNNKKSKTKHDESTEFTLSSHLNAVLLKETATDENETMETDKRKSKRISQRKAKEILSPSNEIEPVLLSETSPVSEDIKTPQIPRDTPQRTLQKTPQMVSSGTQQNVILKGPEKTWKTPRETPEKTPQKTSPITPRKSPRKTPLKTPLKTLQKTPQKTPRKSPRKTSNIYSDQDDLPKIPQRISSAPEKDHQDILRSSDDEKAHIQKSTKTVKSTKKKSKKTKKSPGENVETVGKDSKPAVKTSVQPNMSVEYGSDDNSKNTRTVCVQINTPSRLSGKKLFKNPLQPNKTLGNPVQPNRTLGNPVQPNRTLGNPVQPNRTLGNPVQPNRTLGNPVQPNITLGNPVQPNRTLGNLVQPNRTLGNLVQPNRTLGNPIQTNNSIKNDFISDDNLNTSQSTNSTIEKKLVSDNDVKDDSKTPVSQNGSTNCVTSKPSTIQYKSSPKSKAYSSVQLKMTESSEASSCSSKSFTKVSHSSEKGIVILKSSSIKMANEKSSFTPKNRTNIANERDGTCKNEMPVIRDEKEEDSVTNRCFGRVDETNGQTNVVKSKLTDPRIARSDTLVVKDTRSTVKQNLFQTVGDDTKSNKTTVDKGNVEFQLSRSEEDSSAVSTNNDTGESSTSENVWIITSEVAGSRSDSSTSSTLNIKRKSDISIRRKQSLATDMTRKTDGTKNESIKAVPTASSILNTDTKSDTKSHTISEKEIHCGTKTIKGDKVMSKFDTPCTSSSDVDLKNENNDRNNFHTKTQSKHKSIKNEVKTNETLKNSRRSDLSVKDRKSSHISKTDKKEKSKYPHSRDEPHSSKSNNDNNNNRSSRDDRHRSSSSSRRSRKSPSPRTNSSRSERKSNSSRKEITRTNRKSPDEKSSKHDRISSSVSGKRRRESDDRRTSSSSHHGDTRSSKKMKINSTSSKEKDSSSTSQKKVGKGRNESADEIVFDVKSVLSSYEDFLMEDEDTSVTESVRISNSEDSLFAIEGSVTKTSVEMRNTNVTTTMSTPCSSVNSNVSYSNINMMKNQSQNSKNVEFTKPCLKVTGVPCLEETGVSCLEETGISSSTGVSSSSVKSKIDLKTYLSRSRKFDNTNFSENNNVTKSPCLTNTIIRTTNSNNASNISYEHKNSVVEDTYEYSDSSTAEYIGSPGPPENTETRTIDNITPTSTYNSCDKESILNPELQNSHTENRQPKTENLEIQSDGVELLPLKAVKSSTSPNELSIGCSDEFSYSEWPAPSPQIPLPTRSDMTCDESSCSNLPSPPFAPSLSKSPSKTIENTSVTPKELVSDDTAVDVESETVDHTSVREAFQANNSAGRSSRNYNKWTQDEDQKILTTFMGMKGNEQKTCSALETILPERSLLDIMKRVDYLKEHLYDKFGISSGGESDEDDTDSRESVD